MAIVLSSKGKQMEMIKELGNVKEGLQMIKEILFEHKKDLPEGKTVNDFGGGYVRDLGVQPGVGFRRCSRQV